MSKKIKIIIFNLMSLLITEKSTTQTIKDLPTLQISENQIYILQASWPLSRPA